MTTFQAVAIVTVGTLMFQIADIGKSVYTRGRDISASQNESQNSYQLKNPAEIDRLAKDQAFLHSSHTPPSPPSPHTSHTSHTPPSDISPIDPQSASIK